MRDNVVVPMPPLEIDNVPDYIFDAFIEVNCEPSPIKKKADKVLDVLFHVKFADCTIDVAAFPINI